MIAVSFASSRGCMDMLRLSPVHFLTGRVPFLDDMPHDGWLAFHATLYGGVGYLPEVLVKYRQHAGQCLWGCREEKEKDHPAASVRKEKKGAVADPEPDKRLLQCLSGKPMCRRNDCWASLWKPIETSHPGMISAGWFFSLGTIRLLLAVKNYSTPRKYLFCLKMLVKISESVKSTKFTPMPRDLKTFIISRTDAIGDVVLTLPVAGVLRSLYPSARIIFLGRSYTKEIIKACEHIDEFLNWDELESMPEAESSRILKGTRADVIIHVLPNPRIARLARRAGIKLRIGTTNRLYHWFTCNRRVRLSRKKITVSRSAAESKASDNIGGQTLYAQSEIAGLYGLSSRRLPPLPSTVAGLPDPTKFNLILHPKIAGAWTGMGVREFYAADRAATQGQVQAFCIGQCGGG